MMMFRKRGMWTPKVTTDKIHTEQQMWSYMQNEKKKGIFLQNAQNVLLKNEAQFMSCARNQGKSCCDIKKVWQAMNADYLDDRYLR